MERNVPSLFINLPGEPAEHIVTWPNEDGGISVITASEGIGPIEEPESPKKSGPERRESIKPPKSAEDPDEQKRDSHIKNQCPEQPGTEELDDRRVAKAPVT